MAHMGTDIFLGQIIRNPKLETCAMFEIVLLIIYGDMSNIIHLSCLRNHQMFMVIYIYICSMYGIFTNICPKNHPNVGKYTIHGSYGIYIYISCYNHHM